MIHFLKVKSSLKTFRTFTINKSYLRLSSCPLLVMEDHSVSQRGRVGVSVSQCEASLGQEGPEVSSRDNTGVSGTWRRLWKRWNRFWVYSRFSPIWRYLLAWIESLQGGAVSNRPRPLTKPCAEWIWYGLSTHRLSLGLLNSLKCFNIASWVRSIEIWPSAMCRQSG